MQKISQPLLAHEGLKVLNNCSIILGAFPSDHLSSIRTRGSFTRQRWPYIFTVASLTYESSL